MPSWGQLITIGKCQKIINTISWMPSTKSTTPSQKRKWRESSNIREAKMRSSSTKLTKRRSMMRSRYSSTGSYWSIKNTRSPPLTMILIFNWTQWTPIGLKKNRISPKFQLIGKFTMKRFLTTRPFYSDKLICLTTSQGGKQQPASVRITQKR